MLININFKFKPYPQGPTSFEKLHDSYCSLPFENRMCCSEYPIDNVEITTAEFSHHFWQQVRPFFRKIFSSYNADGITKLKDTQTEYVTREWSFTRSDFWASFLFMAEQGLGQWEKLQGSTLRVVRSSNPT